MGKWDDFEAEAKADSVFNYSRCGMGLLLDSLHPDVSTAIEGAMRRSDIMGSAILRKIKEKGVQTDISDPTLRRHRSGKCSCAKRSST